MRPRAWPPTCSWSSLFMTRLRLRLLEPGDRLPTAAGGARLAVGPNAVLKAYRDLERDGLVRRVLATGYALLPLAAPRAAGRSWSRTGPPPGNREWLFLAAVNAAPASTAGDDLRMTNGRGRHGASRLQVRIRAEAGADVIEIHYHIRTGEAWNDRPGERG